MAVELVQALQDRMLSVDMGNLSPNAAGKMVAECFQEQNDLFTQRFVALREKVPLDVAAKWDEQAVLFGSISSSLEVGDARPLKNLVIRSGMEVNRQAQLEGHQSALGNALYGLGATMSSTVETQG